MSFLPESRTHCQGVPQGLVTLTLSFGSQETMLVSLRVRAGESLALTPVSTLEEGMWLGEAG